MKKIILKCLIVIFLLQLLPGLSRAQQSFDIYYHVPFVPQPTYSMYCWSASIAMILWWKNNTDAEMSLEESLSPEQVDLYGNLWNTAFREGLNYANSTPFDTWGFKTVGPQSFTLDYFKNLLLNSPLWVSYDLCGNPLQHCGNHAVVVVGAKSDGTQEGTTVIIHDPGRGRDKEMPYTEFIARLQALAEKLIKHSEADGVPTDQIHCIAYLPR